MCFFNYAFEISSVTGEPFEVCIHFFSRRLKICGSVGDRVLVEGRGQGLAMKRTNQKLL